MSDLASSSPRTRLERSPQSESRAQNASERSAPPAIAGVPGTRAPLPGEGERRGVEPAIERPFTDAPTRAEGTPLLGVEIDHVVSQYLALAQGNPATALTIAIADLLDACAEAELRRWALDQWTSRGYVRGRASTILAVQQHAGRCNAIDCPDS